jgi:thioredoxin 1
MNKFVTAFVITLTLAGAAQAELPSATEASVRQSLSSGKPTVIDLGARTCIPCKKMAPIHEATANRFRIQMIPTQIFFDARGKEVKRHIGFMEKAEIVRELKAAGLK